MRKVHKQTSFCSFSPHATCFFLLSFTSESFMALAEVAGDVVHAGPVVEAGVGKALIDVGLTELAYAGKR